MPLHRKNIATDIRPLKEHERIEAHPCMAQHATPVPALYELLIEGRQRLLLCQTHVDDFIDKTVVGIEPDPAKKLT